ncbi:pyridoxamine 5'-phosphate oxidase family protein [Azospirillum sp. YIM DDC1]|uniref:Pyridoxamine 5'-phosphate oxidase family protein n=1 Tax=Azospirillum aestuarii TaxID=2802052 RepID=A0ABS1I7R5_9PROT|nr:pyridoxamine 5'-phosphate oxidase family protein [Azospirillum aestuarii]MBK4723011.1 pyridoxamine 5'-phosphate oxidase family protein [Azospirillum aestuarii]
MGFGFLDIAVTPAVRSVQKKLGVAHMWGNFKGRREFDRFSDREAAFIAGRDSFYMATTSETGWPYLQHRGGPGGFLKLLDDRTLAFADYRGNFQYISVGNLSANDKACLFLMDYPRRARLKIYVRAEIVSLDVDPVLTARVLEGTAPKVERIIRLHLETFDWNCPQHIVPRFTEAELAEALRPIRERIEALEAENAALRASRQSSTATRDYL